MLENGYIKLHRKIMLNPIFKKGHYFKVFCYCLMQASPVDTELIVNNEIYKVERGSFITSLQNIKLHCSVTIQQTRTILNFLKSTRMITHYANKHFTHIGVVNYELYQTNQQTKQQSNNNQITIKEQSNNNKVIKKKKEEERSYTEDAQQIINHFNQEFKTNYRSYKSWIKNFAQWRETYEVKEIMDAVTKARSHPFWGDKMNPDMLFRVGTDRIGSILNDRRSERGEIIRL